MYDDIRTKVVRKLEDNNIFLGWTTAQDIALIVMEVVRDHLEETEPQATRSIRELEGAIDMVALAFEDEEVE